MRRAIPFFLCDFIYFCSVLFFVLIANRRGCKGLDLECSRAAWGCILHSSCLKRAWSICVIHDGRFFKSLKVLLLDWAGYNKLFTF